jgi:hypothetical protein
MLDSMEAVTTEPVGFSVSPPFLDHARFRGNRRKIECLVNTTFASLDECLVITISRL